MTDTTIEPVHSSRRSVVLRPRYIVPVLILAILLAVFLSLRLGNAGSEQGPHPTLSAALVTPSREEWNDRLMASGAVEPWQEASIGTQIGGVQLQDVRVNVGDRVHKGQVLAVLNPALLKADEARLNALYAQAKADLDRAHSLQGAGAISDQEVLQFETSAKTAKAALVAKHLELQYTQVRAPDNGVISARAATLGAVVPVGQELFRLIRRNRLEWRGELTAAQMAQVSPGEKVTLSLPDGDTSEATIRQLAPSLDNGSRLGIAYADIPAKSSARAGMYAKGSIITGHSPALTVPASSVITRDGRNYVVLVKGSKALEKVLRRPVSVGRRQGDRIEIKNGLDPRDRIVVEGGEFLNDGDLVRVVPDGNAAEGERP